MMQNDFLVKIKKELCNYRNIPKDLINYIIDVIEKDKEIQLLSPILTDKKQRKNVWGNMDSKFKKGINITKLSPVELLERLDFHPKDTEFSKFDAMWAELRTIFFLNDLGLYDITPLKAKNKKNTKSADMIAQGHSYKYTIEVFCRTFRQLENVITMPPKISKKEIEELGNKNKFEQNPKPEMSLLFQYYLCKAKEKKQQLDNTTEKYLCDKNILVMVLNDPYFLNSTNCYVYKKLLKEISIKLNWGCGYHYAIITGMSTWGICDDVIYPPII